ncbi:carboxypeptidase-like regulatory domain-containing protein [Mucilaginibacter sp.]|uniref:carboxypeptidase-like regulatory domain-containing protein n=1 Tax=Mucilaginibacter sp. TaxID=1882438 RepID=UPI0025EDE72F|nr:carboxypeptidase-like regulatory domain-containing protein [Mucilaginibacter sp.]
MKTTIIAFVFLTCCFRVSGQQRLSGRVSDPDGAPLSGATVFVSESKIGTTTDVKGNFALSAPVNGSVKLVVSYIGYETQVKTIAPGMGAEMNFTMNPVSNQLKDVIVTSRSNDNWKHWGAAFISAFIGNSAFSAHCTIVNPQEIGFEYDPPSQVLHAYASVPVLVRNEDLGYLLTITLVDFTLYSSNNDVDYLAYYLFEEMKGNAGQQAQWEDNRRKAYALSLMHFTRALYAGKLREEGFEVRQFMINDGKEKERVKKLYRQLALHTDSLKNSRGNAEDVDKLIESRFGKDSLRYYKKILAQKDNEVKMSEPLRAGDISVKKEKNLSLNFKTQLQVVYKKNKEPEEYYNYRNHIALNTESISVTSTGISTSQLVMPPKINPYTELWLTKGIPADIKENGAIENNDLYLHGFWGWWEKIATKLPYEYYPD